MTNWTSLVTVLSGQRFARLAWKKGLRPGSPAAVVFALACVAIAASIRFALNLLISSESQPFALFYPAVLIATLVGGFTVGALAAIVGGAVALLLMKSELIPSALTAADAVSALLYLTASAVIIWGAEQYRRLARQLEQEEVFRQILVDELGHRLQNKLATVDAIVRYELRDQRDIRDRISARLHSLAATDELIVQRHAAGIDVGMLLRKELAPYDGSRATVSGPAVEVPPKVAVTLALVFHELATNAAKYGALASAHGSIEVFWADAGSEAVIEWREVDGPPVLQPTRSGFGRRIIEEGLRPFGGKVEWRFEPAGLECTITVPVARQPSAESSGPRSSPLARLA